MIGHFPYGHIVRDDDDRGAITAPLSNSVITLSSTSSDVPSGSKLTFGSLNDSVDSIALTLEGLSDNDVAHVTYMLTDSGSSQEAYELPTVDISTNIPSSRFSRLKPYGLLKSIVKIGRAHV